MPTSRAGIDRTTQTYTLYASHDGGATFDTAPYHAPTGNLRSEIDGLSRARTRADHEADAARKLEELKRRMGK